MAAGRGRGSLSVWLWGTRYPSPELHLAVVGRGEAVGVWAHQPLEAREQGTGTSVPCSRARLWNAGVARCVQLEVPGWMV